MIFKEFKTKGQAFIESLFIYIILFSVLIGSFMVSKFILERQSILTTSRLAAFSPTYGKNELPTKFIKEKHSKLNSPKISINHAKAQATLSKGFFSFFEKILNYVNSTKSTKVISNFEFNDEFRYFLDELNKNIELKEELFLDDDPCEHNKKLKWALYGIALVKSGFPRNTTLSSLGSKLIDSSKDITDKEIFEYD